MVVNPCIDAIVKMLRHLDTSYSLLILGCTIPPHRLGTTSSACSMARFAIDINIIATKFVAPLAVHLKMMRRVTSNAKPFNLQRLRVIGVMSL